MQVASNEEHMSSRRIALLIVGIFSATTAAAQVPESIFEGIARRDIGPSVMSGRVTDFAVYEDDPSIFYVASASGGLLKTINGGGTWTNVFDSQTTVSIGDVAINPTDPNVVWVGTGEANNRQSSSWGDGIYKSSDGGKTWKHMGLRESQHIGRIVIDPQDTDIVYVAALGRLWGANKERGVFKTTDGGVTWQHVLAINESTGAVDVIMDPSNPKVVYAAAYQRRRTGWGFNGGGKDSGIYKTVDAGRTWRRLTTGLPEGDTGRIGLDVYRRNSNIVYAIVENREGGVFRSEDKGETWTKMNSLNPRPMYFSQIRVDPNEPQRIYVNGTNLHVSDDGGKTFRELTDSGVHSDHHAFWIDPKNSRHIINGNDGGVWVSRDRTLTWEHLNNYPIGQFYNVTVDMQQPYHIYGGMQDNASWGGPSSVRSRQGIANEHWYQMLSCDGMFTVVDPTDGDTIYTNCQNGRIVRYDRKTGERKMIMPQPEEGQPQSRWNWTAPIVVSPHDGKTIYTGGDKVFKSTDRGQRWTVISPDLTMHLDREELVIMGVSGRDITVAKNDGMSSFGNITALAESPRRAGLLYAGTDDGNLQVSRDSGATWQNLTGKIAGVPKLIYVSRVTPSAFAEGTVYASFDGHRSDDFKPYVYMSTDFGETWRSITNNLPATAGSVYVIKEDPKNQNLLYVGTEFGLFVSTNRGANWTRWKGMPTVAVYDLVVHPRDNDLVLGTHGRSFIVFDDISPLQQLTAEVLTSPSHLFDIGPAVQYIPNENGWFLGGRSYRAPNRELGAFVNYYLRSPAKDDVTIAISDASGKVVRQLKGPKTAGLHRVAWDLRDEPSGPASTGLAGALVLTNLGPFVPPGEYRVQLTADGRALTKTVKVGGDPLVEMSDADRQTLYRTLLTLTDMQRTVGSAAEAATRLDQRLQQIAETMKAYPNAPAAVKSSVATVTKQVTDLRMAIAGAGGGRGGGGGFGGGPQPLRNRINSLKSEVVGSQSLPTQVQSTQVPAFRKQLGDLVERVNTVITTTLPSLYKQLNENSIYPSVGEPIKLVRADGTAPPR
jgi:photosystem II stability/assembly factor-like uncharacterized protein